jgi:hypothetical protein
MKASRIHFWCLVVWGTLLVPSVLWWRDSIFWVNLMSWYAIVVSHWGALLAAKADEAVEGSPRED